MPIYAAKLRGCKDFEAGNAFAYFGKKAGVCRECVERVLRVEGGVPWNEQEVYAGLGIFIIDYNKVVIVFNYPALRVCLRLLDVDT